MTRVVIRQPPTPRLRFTLRNNADWQQPFALMQRNPLSGRWARRNLVECELWMSLGGLSLSSTNGGISIDDEDAGPFAIAVPARDMSTLRDHYGVDCLLMTRDGHIEVVFIASIDVCRGSTRVSP
jgi:hypothetical protein